MKLIQRISRHRNLILFVVALALGALAAFGARGYISEQLAIERERLVPRQPMARVVVAKRDLPKGEVVSAETMAVREVPAAYLPASAIAPERFDGYVGTRLLGAMRAGEPLLSGSLEGADPSTFAAKVRTGIRAITIAVDEVNSLSGMLQPGDRIDLLLSVRLPAGSSIPQAQELTRPLVQDLRVLATGRQVRPGGDERNARQYTAITVEVTPTQAQKLVVAQRSGKLTAMLRNPEDREPIDHRPMDVYGLLGINPVTLPPVEQRPLEIIVGGKGALKTVERAHAATSTLPAAESVQLREPIQPAAADSVAVPPPLVPPGAQSPSTRVSPPSRQWPYGANAGAATATPDR